MTNRAFHLIILRSINRMINIITLKEIDLSLSHLKWLCKPPVVPSVGVGKERGGLQPVKRHFHAFNFARAGPRVNAVRGGCLGLLKR